MIERKADRRSLPTPGDRRRNDKKADVLDWSEVVPAIPGMIRPGFGEAPRERERRLDPASGLE